MTNKFRFTLSILAVLAVLSILSQVAVAGTPKVTIPVERSYYLTKDLHYGDDVIGACGDGKR